MRYLNTLGLSAIQIFEETLSTLFNAPGGRKELQETDAGGGDQGGEHGSEWVGKEKRDGSWLDLIRLSRQC